MYVYGYVHVEDNNLIWRQYQNVFMKNLHQKTNNTYKKKSQKEPKTPTPTST